MSQLITFLPLIIDSLVSSFSLSWAAISSLIASVFSLSKKRFFLEWAIFIHTLISCTILFVLHRTDLLKYGSMFFGLFSALFALISILVKRPFTLQYARLQTPREFWESPVFYRVNYMMTGALAIFFLFEAGSKILSLFHPALCNYSIVSAFYSTLTFTFIKWFPKWYKNKARRQA